MLLLYIILMTHVIKGVKYDALSDTFLLDQTECPYVLLIHDRLNKVAAMCKYKCDKLKTPKRLYKILSSNNLVPKLICKKKIKTGFMYNNLKYPPKVEYYQIPGIPFCFYLYLSMNNDFKNYKTVISMIDYILDKIDFMNNELRIVFNDLFGDIIYLKMGKTIHFSNLAFKVIHNIDKKNNNLYLNEIKEYFFNNKTDAMSDRDINNKYGDIITEIPAGKKYDFIFLANHPSIISNIDDVIDKANETVDDYSKLLSIIIFYKDKVTFLVSIYSYLVDKKNSENIKSNNMDKLIDTIYNKIDSLSKELSNKIENAKLDNSYDINVIIKYLSSPVLHLTTRGNPAKGIAMFIELNKNN